jgi:hypothetical protein
MFPDEGRFFEKNYTPGPLATDEAFTLAATSSDINGMRLVLGEISASNLYEMADTWNGSYTIIRKCNTILKRIDEAKDMTTIDRFQIIGYTRFIRAYAYYKILIDFGPPILLGDEVIASNEDLAYYNRARSTYDEAVEYICNELEETAGYLSQTVSLMEFGYPTKGAAYGLIARLRLFHASPLFNGGAAARSCFGTWKRSTDGAQYVSQSYSEQRWALAAAAAKRIIDMGIYSLYTVDADGDTPALPENVISDPDYYKPWSEGGAAGKDHFRSYSEMFTGEAISSVNPEFVWARQSGTVVTNTQNSFPVTTGGWNNQCVTQKVIDAYSMADGKTIYDSSTDYPYSETGFTTAQKRFSGYQLNSGVYNMYVNREMRFYASIGFSECYWPMSSSTTTGNYNLTLTYYYNSSNGKGGTNFPLNYPTTGYVIKKFVHPSDAWGGNNARRMDKAYAMIRYADVLLWYAEALNNLTGDHTVELGGKTYAFFRDTEEIKNAFDQVRHRAGLPGPSSAELADANKMQELLEKERMVEFLHENQRYYDVRRWGIYEKTESEPIVGMNTESVKDGFYRRTIPNSSRIGARIVNKKLILLPLPLDEVRRLPLLDQNPGWED